MAFRLDHKAESVTDYTLHEHQVRAVKHLQNNPRAGLFLPVGAGKTLSVLHTLTPDHLPALVVAPKTVAEHVWSEEPAKWRPDLTVGAAVGSPVRRETAVWSRADLTVISRDNLPWLLSILKRSPYKTVVLDESQSFKAKSSARWKAARAFTRKASYVWAMTGTPAGNGLMDLWAQVYLIDDGHRLGATLGQYRQQYFDAIRIFLPTGPITKWELKKGAEDAIYKRIADVCLHIPLIGLDLPGMNVNQIKIDMPPAAWQLYKQLKEDMIGDLDMLGGTEKMTVPSAGVLSSKLSQIAAGAIYGETDPETGDRGELVPLHTEKLDQLASIVEQTSGGILVFYRFRFELDAILKRFPQATHIKAKGAVAAWNRGEIPILVAHPASAGHGLNLQFGGNTIVWTSLSWSAEEWIQGNGRLDRQGQKNIVMVHILGVPGTVDDNVFQVVQGKVTVQQALLDAVS